MCKNSRSNTKIISDDRVVSDGDGRQASRYGGHLLSLDKIFPVVVDGGSLRHEARDLAADVVNVSLELGVDLVGSCSLLAEVVDLLLQSSVPVFDFAMSDQQLLRLIAVCEGECTPSVVEESA